MTIHLNDPGDFTRENVRQLIASVDDSKHRQLPVTVGGIAFISDTVANVATEGIAFSIATWCEGNDYSGESAARDEAWVTRVYGALQKHWPASERYQSVSR
jgi:hypothetical protein